MKRKLSMAIVGMTFAFCFAGMVMADPIDGRDILKFQQRPMLETVIPNPQTPAFEIFRGHNELSTAWGIPSTTGVVTEYRGRFMADDFADRFKTPVVHVKWWGSYLNTISLTQPVQRFLISFEKDVAVNDPNNTLPFSHPGDPLLNQVVFRGPLAPGSGTFTEEIVGFSLADGPTFEYNAELHLNKEFFQEPDTVYWLKIVALYDIPANLPDDLRPRWGWHNRDYTIRNPLASVKPEVVPGEDIVGFLPGPAGTTTPIWHFQDDAVTGLVRVERDPNNPMSFIMPDVVQREYEPTRYEFPWDGPRQIADFSKDLAFELYTVPEPMSWTLVAVGIALVTIWRRR